MGSGLAGRGRLAYPGQILGLLQELEQWKILTITHLQGFLCRNTPLTF